MSTQAIPTDNFLSVRAAAKLLAVSQRSIRQFIADGRLPAVRVGGAVRIVPTDLAGFVQPVEVKQK